MTASPPTDERLLADFRAGDRLAFAELARRHERSMLGLAAGLLGGRRDLACDAVQETWMRVIRFADRFDGRSQFKTWLFRILVNRCHDLLSLADGPATVAELPDPPTPTDSAPTRPLEKSDELQTLRTAVARLPLDRRSIVLLCYHNGLTHEQAAEILEIPAGTLKSRLHAALTELREVLSPKGNE